MEKYTVSFTLVVLSVTGAKKQVYYQQFPKSCAYLWVLHYRLRGQLFYSTTTENQTHFSRLTPSQGAIHYQAALPTVTTSQAGTQLDSYYILSWYLDNIDNTRSYRVLAASASGSRSRPWSRCRRGTLKTRTSGRTPSLETWVQNNPIQHSYPIEVFLNGPFPASFTLFSSFCFTFGR